MKKIKVEFKPVGLKMDADRNQFALALKTWRLRAGKSQQEVAEAWGSSRYTIMKCENAKPVSWPQAYKIFANLANELRKEDQDAK